MNSEVVSLRQTHDVIKRNYKQHAVTFTFNTDRKIWSWHFTHTVNFEYNGTDCPSLDDAIKRAYKHIDTIMG